jgi:hypothetical protein
MGRRPVCIPLMYSRNRSSRRYGKERGAIDIYVDESYIFLNRYTPKFIMASKNMSQCN